MQCPPSAHDRGEGTTGASAPAPATTERDAGTAPAPRCDKDDLDLLLLHVDFPLLLSLAAKVKELRITGGAVSVSANPPRDPPTVPSNEAIEAAKRIQAKVLASSLRTGQSIPTILRGQYPMTDIIMDDALIELQHEIDAYEYQSATDAPVSPISNDDLVAVLSDSLGTYRAASFNDRSQGQLPPPSIHYDPKKKGDAIAIKYSKWQTDILMGWMITNSESPFPDPCDVAELAAATGLTHSQVVNWTTNVRKRNLKATCRGHKKPHHFIDFLFLKQDREGRLGGRDAGGSIRYPPTETVSDFAMLVPSNSAAASEFRTASPTVQPMPSHRETRGGGRGGHRSRQRAKAPYQDPLADPLRKAPALPKQDEAQQLEPLEWNLPDQEKSHGLLHLELLQDFANYWTDDDEDSSYLRDSSTTLAVASQRAVDELGEVAWPQSKPPARSRSASAPSRGLHTRHRRMLMPSVTLDSHEDERFGAPESTARKLRTDLTATTGGQWKRNRAPTPPPLDELYLYPTDLEEDVDEYHQLNSHESRHQERYDDDGEDDCEDDWIKAWDIDEVRPLNL